MKNCLALLITVLGYFAVNAQVTEVELMSRMNGFVFLDGGGTTGLWGYGYVGAPFITLPAPLLEFNQGDSIDIHFTNESPESHTIHFHGLDVDQVNDGVPSTSFYVLPNETVTYSFKADHPGTFLYHCHVTTTLHLTMGMYGMISVNGPDQTLFEGGPSYTDVYHFLASDLEVATNDDPTGAFPFHEITPDYFMINGKSGNSLLENEEESILSYVGDTIALRLGSMAYSKTIFHFPLGSHPKVWMSDGRTVPEPFETNQLEIYPGERYTVMLYPDESLSENIGVDYFSMLSGELVGTNEISLVNLGISEYVSSLSEYAPLKIYPNPVTDQLTIRTAEDQTIEIIDLLGQRIKVLALSKGINSIDVKYWKSGMYVIMSPGGQTQRLIVR